MASRSIKDVIAEGRLKRFIDRRLIRALSHPMREHLLAVFNERIASSSEIGRELGLEAADIYHHVDELEKLGCIERVESRRRRGAEEHFFEAKATMLVDDRGWRKIPASVKLDMAVSYIQSILDDITGAVSSGALAASALPHVSWLPSIFDRLGWEEAIALMNQALAGLMEIQKRSAGRIATTGEPGIPTTIGLLRFETLPGAVAQARTR